MHIEVSAVDSWSMMETTQSEASEQVAARVQAARELQHQRYSNHSARTNADASGDLLQAISQPDDAARALLEKATGQLQLSMRGMTRVIRVARTIADLAQTAPLRSRIWPRHYRIDHVRRCAMHRPHH